ncbi:MAG: M14 metallopeptidase family protein, partial [Candidatus Marinimicrobia bacterium]|nr:M14 metallopeptidase family protein [Candidatus Neomarinimicrobiota bacterium]
MKRLLSVVLTYIITSTLLYSQVELLNPRFEFTPGIQYEHSIQSPKDYLGYNLGMEYTLYADVMGYLRNLDIQSGRVSVHPYGKTHEGRELEYLLITSEKNRNRLEEIRKNNLRLTDPRNVNSRVASKIIKDNPGIYWLSYNVHGNEASSTEAVMQVAYRLAAGQDKETKTILENSVVILVPCINPDGRDRYVYWYKSTQSNVTNADQFDLEHDEPWPGGRTNHYWFDLNRDWVWMVHPESQGRITAYQHWMPQIHVDYHEMGFNRNYFTMPGTTPRNLILPEPYEALSDTFGLANIAVFDKHKVMYYTREGFDFFYPGYGSSYPSLMGSIGMLVEQGGHSRGGRAVKTDDGYVLTLRQRIFDHYETSFATLSAAVRNRNTLNQYFHDTFKQSTNKGKAAVYILPDNPGNHLYDVINMLRTHGVEIHRANSDFVVAKAHDYEDRKQGRQEFKKGDFLIYANQPRHLFLNTVLQREMAIEDSIMYDMATWSAPLAYNLDAFWAETKPRVKATEVSADLIHEIRFSRDDDAYAYVIDWHQRHAPKALSKLWEKGYRVRSARKEFNDGTRTYPQGTLVILMGRNQNKEKSVQQDMATIAKTAGVNIDAFQTGRMKEGIDFGSGNMVTLKQPKIGLMVDKPFNSYTAGQLWFLLDKETELGISRLRMDRLKGLNLKDYNVLIFPGSRGSIDSSIVDKLKGWVSDGGTLVATEGSAGFFTEKSGLTKVKTVKPPKPEEENIPASAYTRYEDRADSSGLKRIPGSAFYGVMDNSNPLAFGLPERLYTLKQNASALVPNQSLQTVGYYHKDPLKLKVAGYASMENLKLLAGKTFAAVQPVGRGKVVYLI